MARIARFFLPENVTKRSTTKSQRKTISPAPKTPRQAQAADDLEKLLTSANNASGPARAAWLAFLALLTYLLVTLAGVTDKDLLLNSPVTLPIANVSIPLFSFFLAAPFLLVLVHLSLLLQHVMLAHQYWHFSAAVAAGEDGPARDHPDRHLVHNYVFSQLLAGANPPLLLHMLMRLMVFVTLSLLPVLVLLYFQIKFLPSHNVAITHAHRFAILLDLTLLFVVRPFIAMPYLRPRGQKLRFGNPNWSWELSYRSLGAAVCMVMVVMSFSLLVATIPQACAWPFEEQPEDTEAQPRDCFSLDRATAGWWAEQVDTSDQNPYPSVEPREIFAPTMWLFEGKGSWFHRNLELSEAKLLREEPSIETIALYRLAGKTEQNAIFDVARGLNLQGRDLRYANLTLVNLDKADLRKAKLQGAILWNARLHATQLSQANLQGANLSYAQLQGANLTQAQLPGTRLWDANLQGADLWMAELQGADLEGAQLQGANLDRAKLQGVILDGAKLHGADLEGAQLQGASLWGAKLQGANLKGAQIWKTAAPDRSDLEHAIPMEKASIVRPVDGEISEFEEIDYDALIEFEEENHELDDEARREKLQSLLEQPPMTNEAQNWDMTEDYQIWTQFSEQPIPNPQTLAEFLGELACKDNTGGYVIHGISMRVIQKTEDYGALVAKLLLGERKDCAAAEYLTEALLASLRELAAPE